MARRTQFRLLVALTIVWAAWAGWSLLGRATPYTLRVLDDVGAPIAGASVDVRNSQIGTSAEDGTVEVVWNRSSAVLEVSAAGHITQTVTIAERPEGAVDVVLKARILRGRVVDESGAAVESARVVAGPASGVTDTDGRFSLRGAEPGRIEVSRPAWVDATFDWDGGVGESVIEMTPFIARAVHISGEAAEDDLNRFFEMTEGTELNALMLDLKDESGLIWYDSADPTAKEVDAIRAVFDLSQVAARAHELDLYLIGRLVVFSDPTAAIRKPEMAVWDSATNQPYNANGQYFLDPTDPDARAYGLSLAVEACEMGIDEVQFDYVRFPDKRTESTTFDDGISIETRTSTIVQFLEEAVAALHPLGCAVGADVFGFTTTATDDGGIGQRWEDVTAVVDVASPMVYPSHYSAGWYGFDVPNDHPGPMVTRAIEDGISRMSRNVVIRPWLQDFNYTTEQVREQIEVAEQFGLGWMLWNAKSNVTVAALRVE